MSQNSTNTIEPADDQWDEIPQEQMARALDRLKKNKLKANDSVRRVKEPTTRERAVVVRSGSSKKPKHLDHNGAPACGEFPAEKGRSVERSKIKTLRWCSHCEPYVTEDGDAE